MAEEIHINSKKAREAQLVEGMYKQKRMACQQLYDYCKQYFEANYQGVFIIGDVAKGEIFQNTFIRLWENIESKKIFVEDGVLKGKDGKPFTSLLTTYFMSIAKFNYLEYVRDHPHVVLYEDNKNRDTGDNDVEGNDYIDMVYDDAENIQLEIIADILSHMSPRCNEILVKFYYEEMKLETIMDTIKSIGSKDSLKTKKHKCMEYLRTSANNIYNQYLNH
jgi:DNA-directed RNA polymerase specialized sigma24 family protein